MALRTKFGLVLLLLAGTLAVNVGASVWAIRFLDREFAWPLESVQGVMSGLHDIKRSGEAQVALIGAGRRAVSDRPGADHPGPTDQAHAEFDRLDDQVGAALDRLERLESYLVRSGISTTRNLRARSQEIVEGADRWFETGDGQAWSMLVAALDTRHELIERIEGRIIDDARLAVDHGQRLQFAVSVIIGVSVAGAIATAGLMTLLVRRWVLVPVEQLRVGAERLGRGDFEHRIGVSTGDELGRLGDEFNEMAALIKTMQDERVERERLAAMGEMARRIVHNLRTPLAGIRALAETTKSELTPGSELVGVQERIIGSVDRFEGWLQEMLRASSPIELHLRQFDPRGLVRGVGDAHADAAGSRSIGVRIVGETDLPELVWGDPHHLEQALTALVSNALEYAPAGSEVVLAGAFSDGFWSVRVEDSGPGIPDHLQSTIFRPYFTTRPGGTGIGLALVKRVADQHSGSVVVESPADRESGAGTVFVLRVPIDAGSG